MLFLVCWLSVHFVLGMDLRYLRREPSVSSTSESPEEANCTVPIWGEWYEELSCNDHCGSCGSRVLRRRCLTPECPCSGPTRRELSCSIGVCGYPRAACCPPFKITYYQGNFGCGPQEEEIVAEFLNVSGVVQPPTTTPFFVFPV